MATILALVRFDGELDRKSYLLRLLWLLVSATFFIVVIWTLSVAVGVHIDAFSRALLSTNLSHGPLYLSMTAALYVLAAFLSVAVSAATVRRVRNTGYNPLFAAIPIACGALEIVSMPGPLKDSLSALNLMLMAVLLLWPPQKSTTDRE
ncbi:hypothetical protein [Roseomonas sp. AR75]|uniref:DUF805 domain-containing protein n=1 Tax=Roseomonas sp. AR75 TaxID=2562311 RepID=UPI0010C04E6E|nr:hypothetical protein [Roseomonas sp. AR75]